MTYSRYLDPYIDDIKSGRINHCKDQQQMIDNVLIPVLERKDVYVDDDRIEEGLKLQKYFDYDLLEWEVFLFAVIVGIRFKDRKNIYFTDIRIILGRGSGKNGFLSFLGFYFLSPAHGIKGYDIDLLANSEDQAKTTFMDIHDVITDAPDKSLKNILDHNFHATLVAVTGLKTQSTLRFNTSSKRGKDSKRTGCIMLDEIHEYQDFTNINTLKSGLGKRRDGRCITISTFGHVRGAVFDRQMEQNEEILKAYNPKNRVFPFICRIESENEWDKPECWIKAIPSINDFDSLREQIEKEVVEMPYTPEYRSEFITKRLNFPIGSAETEVASWDDIMATNRELPDLEGWPCIGGLDYAKTNDFVSAVLLFLVGDELCVIQHTWVCNESRDLPGIKAPLKEWEARGDLEFVDAPEIPPELIAEWFAEQGAKYTLLTIAVDLYRFSLMRSKMNEVGIGVGDEFSVPVKLTRKSDTIKVFPVVNSAFVTHRFVWGDLPIMRWYTNNTKVTIEGINYDYGKIEPHARKTDGFMALVHAMTQLDLLESVNVAAPIMEPFVF
ncbi:MAG: terminase large subunit [Lachnospiraceae bacterium]|nr:terminase large subunit [Lachnospiraceae bacterium]